MQLNEIMKDESADWDRKPPAEEAQIQSLVSQSGVELPGEYLAFLRYSNGGAGELDIEPGWFQIWPAEEVIEANRELEVEANIPGYFGFGSNGGGELLAFDTRTPNPWGVYMVPFIPMEEAEAVKVTSNFVEFVAAMGRSTKDV